MRGGERGGGGGGEGEGGRVITQAAHTPYPIVSVSSQLISCDKELHVLILNRTLSLSLSLSLSYHGKFHVCN